ncbi:hypothetical protein L1049_010864 [Liquidambar formosana]|uniref:RNase H type-1 domain-containing protein n=1 Tax=Liquidambar formosana TaxID=63359 RepID=A0AAP0RQW4_LIQFO
MATHFAVEFARDLGLHDVDLEGDNLEVMFAFASRIVSHTVMGLLIEDVLVEVALSFVSCQFMHVDRKGNEVVHGLAKLVDIAPHYYDLDNFPQCEAKHVLEKLYKKREKEREGSKNRK